MTSFVSRAVHDVSTLGVGFVVFVIIATVTLAQSPDPPIPVIPHSFSTEYTIGFNLLPASLFAGRFVFDWESGGAYLSLFDNAAGEVPFGLTTSLISHPAQGTSGDLDIYAYLSEGRCWQLESQNANMLHFVPIEIPSDASYQGDVYIDGAKCSQWAWQYTGFFVIGCNITVRYSDNAMMIFNVFDPSRTDFGVSVSTSGFTSKVDPSEFAVPPGPCLPVNNTQSQFALRVISESLLNFVTDSDTQPGEQDRAAKVESNVFSPPPQPPQLNQWFTADVRFGYALLEKSSSYKPTNDYYTGHVVVDKTTGGVSLHITDAQKANVPWEFQTSVISNPLNRGYVNGYTYLSNGRCWMNANSVANPDWPLHIPSGATFVGKEVIYGHPATIWSFQGSFMGYAGLFHMAVALKDSSILFLNGYQVNYPSSNVYVVLSNFNTTKPDPRFYQAPPGPCSIVYS